MKYTIAIVCLMLWLPQWLTAEELPYDCTVVALDETDESLSKEQRIALLEKSLQDSIDRYENCINTVTSNNSNQGEASGSGSNGSSNNNQESTEKDSTEKETNNDGDTLDNGAANQDVKAVDNDTAICSLLKEELDVETDPEKKAELKEIYKDYRC